MKRIGARFDDPDAAAVARSALEDAGFELREPAVANPFFDPATAMPEGRGIRWGGLLGGALGGLLLYGLATNAFLLPRSSPIMTAGESMLVVLGIGLGVVAGGFVGGAVGTFRPAPPVADSRVTVVAPDHRVGEAEDVLRAQGATAVNAVAAYHEHPLRTEASGSSADDTG